MVVQLVNPKSLTVICCSSEQCIPYGKCSTRTTALECDTRHIEHPLLSLHCLEANLDTEVCSALMAGLTHSSLLFRLPDLAIGTKCSMMHVCVAQHPRQALFEKPRCSTACTACLCHNSCPYLDITGQFIILSSQVSTYGTYMYVC